jgi:hypothetical protein
MYEKKVLKDAFHAGWTAGLDESTTIDELFEKWYDDYTASRPLETSRRRGW